MKFLKGISLGFIAGTFIMGAMPTMAKSGVDYIDIVWRNIKICVDGVQMTPKDSAGKELEPFIYNGTTYLPVRAVAEAVGKDVTWDSSTSTVYIGKSGVTKYLGQQIKAYQMDYYVKEGAVTMGGTKYTNSVFTSDGYYHSSPQSAYYNLNGLYNSMSGVCGITDGSSYDCTIYIYGDDILLQQIECGAGKMPKNFAVNVTGVTQLRMQFGDDGSMYNGVALGSVSFS